MRYGSVCSGVEAASLAWMSLGWECKFVAEVEPFPCAVLQERFGATAPIHPLDPEEATNEKDRKMRISWMKQNEFLKKEGIIPNEGDFTKIGKNMPDKSICLSAELPAKTFRSQEKEPDLTENVHLSPSTLYDLLTNRSVNGSSGKTYRACSVPMGEEISQPFYHCLSEERLPSPKTDGVQQDLFAMIEETDSVWRGACWTHNLPEHPDFRSPYRNADGVCSLSDILVTGLAPLKYYLSQNACNGILRRASKRGKELPEILKKALEQQAVRGIKVE